MFDFVYPDLELVWIGHSVVDGGFVLYEDILKGRKQRKKEKLDKI